MDRPRAGNKARIQVRVVEGASARDRSDHVATEEPLEIRLLSGGTRRTLAITMRTPGADFELAAGFLYGEGVVGNAEDIRRIAYCTDADLDRAQRYNVVTVELRAEAVPELRGLERHFYTTSACGVCGKASLEALELSGCSAPAPGPIVDAPLLFGLSDRLRQGQGLFDATGGLHAAALFSSGGDLLVIREDVGRHNAVDKVVGWALHQRRVPLSDAILMVSGRASFEIMQKALAAGVPIVCAVSAPSTLAVDVATRFGLTLVGFLRGERFNIYSGQERIRTLPPSEPEPRERRVLTVQTEEGQ
jgi:FdhD protein